ncbi:MAG TPA: CCA tRNA nucleotidyltransferase, partial [Anaerolineae bacterium]|nr:CCA tRNA nucleotidyltransferase [Anaerolineae bacterium]
NTLAIRLDPAYWGELLDFYGGEADLRNGVIRVLHSLSFVDDPTRMLRAARLESRLGFRLDPRSEQLIGDALPLLKRVSGDRIRHELELIFREAEPERALCRLEELGVLEQIHPRLRCDEWLRRKYRALRRSRSSSPGLADWGLGDDDLPFLYLALLVYRLTEDELGRLLDRLNGPRADRDALRWLPELKRALPRLGKARKASAAARILRPYPARILAVAWVATNRPRLRGRLLRYQTEWRAVEPELTGDDLKEMGLKPGPLFRHLLSALRDARLDGKVHTREEEVAVVRKLLAEEGLLR